MEAVQISRIEAAAAVLPSLHVTVRLSVEREREREREATFAVRPSIRVPLFSFHSYNNPGLTPL